MTVEQKVIVMSNTETDINATLSTENASGWTCVLIVTKGDGSIVTLLFNRVNISV